MSLEIAIPKVLIYPSPECLSALNRTFESATLRSGKPCPVDPGRADVTMLYWVQQCRYVYQGWLVSSEGFDQKTTASVATEDGFNGGVHASQL